MLADIGSWVRNSLRRKPKICIVIPYFGTWPEWMELFLESCRANPSIDWLFFSDCQNHPANFPPNVKIRPTLIQEFLRMVETKVGLNIQWDASYKICDLRPAFGVVFEEYLKRYDFWGWGDIDVIYGDIKSALTKYELGHDCISFTNEHLSGHLCLWRNNDSVRNWFRSMPDWKQRMEDTEYTHLDESHPSVIPDEFKVYAEYSFNTPLSPKLPWTNGKFDFPREWYWRPGSLTNDIDGDREFLYLHFMHWKGGWWPRHCGNAQWEKLDKLVHVTIVEGRHGFKINERGFFPL